MGNEETYIRIHPENDHNSDFIVKVLGLYIGSDNFVEDQLMSSKLPTLREEINTIKGYKDVQTQHLFLKWCISLKINHTLRTTQPALTSEFVGEFDKKKRLLL